MTLRLPFLLALLPLCGSALGDEGMWTPQQLPQLAGPLREAGLELDATQVSRLDDYPLGAVVSLGGCTGSFVSASGLVITNHHCAYGSIQYNSSATRNFITLGFHAQAQADELPAAPGSRVFVTVATTNVTDRIIDRGAARLTGRNRVDAIEDNEKRLVAACERDIGHRCNVVAFHGGLEYWLVKQLEIRDVRLVHAPPEGVGKFGGDTDNWMWPRHTGDFAFYRAYVGKDGKPADFSRDNVPYRPRLHLKLATAGIKEGDFVMVAGYPGRTNRHRLASEVAYTFERAYPEFVGLATTQLQVIEDASKNRDGAALKYASTVASLNNTLKNRQGMLESYRQTDLLARKQRELGELKAWVQGDPERTRRYAADITAVESVIAQRQALARLEFLIGPSTPRLLGAARTLYRLANEKQKPTDLDRKPGFQSRNWPRIRQGLEAIDRRYDEQVDKALAAHFLKDYLALPADQQHTPFLSALGLRRDTAPADIDSRLNALYQGSQLGSPESRLAWLERDVAAFRGSDDTFIRVAVALYQDDRAREDRNDELEGALQRAYANYMRALIDWKNARGEPIYPDANGTLRVTFGKVAGRTAGNPDGVAWTAFTSLRGIVAKHTGSGEFDAPDAQLAAIKAGRFGAYEDPSLRSVPVNFLSTLDITGGNSGSPVLNARGELVGLAFDGTLDAVLSDWDFNAATTRTISVDLRYVLWQLQVVDQADSLLSEMGVRE
ncbi:MAG: S46 family peptidase [Steroidobacteraceae bacterium]